MIRGFHAVIATYGFWLPNDPRGSWSDWVRSFELLRYGKATKAQTHRSLAKKRHDRQLRVAAKKSLRYPPVTLTGQQALAVGHGFRRAIDESGYNVFACCVLPQHAHLVFSRHQHTAEQIVGHLKARATQQLIAEGLHPLSAYRLKSGEFPSPWGRKSWPVFLETEADFERAIQYVNANPLKEGKPRQHWSFVRQYER